MSTDVVATNLCRCLQFRCRDCRWEGDQEAAVLHCRINPGHLTGDVVAPACGQTPCRSAVLAGA